MIEVEMSKDIREYEPKAVGPLSLRQVICGGIGVAIVILMMTKLPCSVEARIILSLIAVTPAIILGWASTGEVSVTKHLKLLLIFKLTPKIRKNICNNTDSYLKPESPKKKIKRNKTFQGKR